MVKSTELRVKVGQTDEIEELLHVGHRPLYVGFWQLAVKRDVVHLPAVSIFKLLIVYMFVIIG
jgi:hypothetical protein